MYKAQQPYVLDYSIIAVLRVSDPLLLQERPIGPPAELKGALLPLPAIDKLRLLQTSRFLGVQTLPMTSGNLMAEREGAELDESTSEVRYSYRKQLTIRWREKRLSPHESRIESNARSALHHTPCSPPELHAQEAVIKLAAFAFDHNLNECELIIIYSMPHTVTKVSLHA